MNKLAAIIAIFGLLVLTVPASAYWTSDIVPDDGGRRHHTAPQWDDSRQPVASSRGGVTCAEATRRGLGCGCFAISRFGISVDGYGVHNGMNLKRANAWLGFRHVSPAANTAAVFPGRHVVRVAEVRVVGKQTQVLLDDAWGQHWRSAAGLIFVQPDSVEENRAVRAVAVRRQRRQHRHYAGA